MSEFQILFLLTAIPVIAWNIITNKYGYALIGAWATSLFVFSVFSLVYGGPLWIIAAINWIIPQLFLTAIISIPFLMFRYRQEQKREQKET
jgi:hypothetical protein